MNKPRLAVLISGNFRNFNETWPLNRATLSSLGVDFDIFFHTWEENPNLEIDVLDSLFNNRFYFSLHMKKFKPFIATISPLYIAREYDFHYISVEKFDELKIAGEFSLGSLKENTLFRSQLNSCGMYIGIDALYQQVKKNRIYTHFLRLRTDFLLDPDSLSCLLESDLVFFGQLLPTPEGPIGDQCYGGNFEKSEFILNTLDSLKLITTDNSWNSNQPVVLAENVIRKRLAPFRNSIKILYLDGKGTILRPKVTRDEQPLNFENLLRIFSHNRSVFISKLSKLRI